MRLITKLSDMTNLQGRTVLITGASRGIGLAIAGALAAHGCNITIASKSDRPNPKLPGTIHSTAALVEALGGKALPVRCDIREEVQVQNAVDRTLEHFGGLDILINNASAIWLKHVADTPMKRFDLMHEVNSRGTFLCAKIALPHLLKSDHAHILTLAPPPNLDPKWWGSHCAYTLAKMGMSFVTLGLAAEMASNNIGISAIWPKTIIATDALNMLPGVDVERCRKPAIMADAAVVLLKRKPAEVNGRFFIDEDLLRESGVHDFSQYAINQTKPLLPDLFLN